MFETRITKLFGIKYPIIQSGMWGVSKAELTAAVSNAGGLGIISAFTFPSPQELAAEIQKTRKLTDKPFGVNVTLLPHLRPAEIEGYLNVVVDNGIRVVETAGRSPEPYMQRLKSAGVKVVHKCTAVRFALTAQRIGCDAVTICGFESAGFPGEDDVTSLVLIPLTADAVEIPVIASGGFSDGRGLAAALALGADAVNMGTRFLATQEAPGHPQVKQWLVQASERDTVMVLRSVRSTARALKNPTSERVLEMEKQGASIQELQRLVPGNLSKLLETGNIDNGVLTVGQGIGLIRDIPTVKQLIDKMIQDAEAAISKLSARD